MVFRSQLLAQPVPVRVAWHRLQESEVVKDSWASHDLMRAVGHTEQLEAEPWRSHTLAFAAARHLDTLAA